MNILDQIKNPIEDEKKLKEILKMYSESRGHFYHAISENNEEISDKEIIESQENYREHILKPSLKYLLDKLKNLNVEKYNKRCEELFEKYKDNKYKLENVKDQLYYPGQEYKNLAHNYSVDELTDRYLNMIERYNQYVRAYLESNITNKSNEELMKQYNITEDDREFMKMYRKCLNHFDGGENIMGFHINNVRLGKSSKREDTDMKFYINAGSDTYKFARKFWEKCDEYKLDFYFKVARPDDIDEYNRTDKMCIYIPAELASDYIYVLRKVREENPDFNYQNPPILTGTIDDWIGVGVDPKETEKGKSRKSYNHLRSNLIRDTVSEVFDGIDRKDVFSFVNSHPEKIKEFKKVLQDKAAEYDIPKENFSLDNAAKNILENKEITKEAPPVNIKEDSKKTEEIVTDEKNEEKENLEKMQEKIKRIKEKREAERKIKNEDSPNTSQQENLEKKENNNEVTEQITKNDDEKDFQAGLEERIKRAKINADIKRKKSMDTYVQEAESKDLTMSQNLAKLKEVIKKMAVDYSTGSKNYVENEEELHNLINTLYNQKAEKLNITESKAERSMNIRRLDAIVSNVVRSAQLIKKYKNSNDVSKNEMDEFKSSVRELNRYFKIDNPVEKSGEEKEI